MPQEFITLNLDDINQETLVWLEGQRCIICNRSGCSADAWKVYTQIFCQRCYEVSIYAYMMEMLEKNGFEFRMWTPETRPLNPITSGEGYDHGN